MRKQNPTKIVVKSPTKALNIRMSYDLWKFMRINSIDKEISINQIINTLLNAYKQKHEARDKI